MKKFTPIAMKCTQEDWESIENKISKDFLYDLEKDWEERSLVWLVRFQN